MACKQETREFNGRQVFVRQWPATKAMEMQIILMNTLGDYATPFVDGTYTFKDVSFVLANCNLPQFASLVRESCFAARIDGKEINSSTLDVELSGDLYTMYQVFAFVMEVNFKDFFALGQQLKE